MISKIFFFLFFILNFGPVPANASGPIGSGGGKGIICTTGDSQKKLYLADTFALFYSQELGYSERFKDSFYDARAEEIIEAAIAYVERVHPFKFFPHPFLKNKKVSLGWLMSHTYANLGLVQNSHLSNLGDDNIDLQKLPKECQEKVQIAVQDFNKNIVRINPDVFLSWTSAETGFLLLHEIYLSLRGTPGDTSPIRKKVAEFLENNSRTNFQSVLQNLLDESQRFNEPHVYTKESTYFYNNCRDQARASTAPCREAKLKMEQQWQEAYSHTGKPILAEIPSSLHCRVMNEIKNEMGYPPQSHFQVTANKSSDDPLNFKNTFKINFLSPSPPEASTFWAMGALQTDKHSSFNPFDKYGTININFQARLSPSESLRLQIVRYNERTEEFLGVLRIDKKQNYSKDSPALQSNFGVSCYSDKTLWIDKKF